MSLKPSTHSEMSPNESLHYAIGLIAYCMAAAMAQFNAKKEKK